MPPLDPRIAARLERVAPRARKLLSSLGQAPGLESAEAAGAHAGPPDLQDQHAIAARLLRSWQASPPPSLAREDFARQAEGIAATLVGRATAAIRNLESGAGNGSIDADDAMALESVMHVRGRPALRVRGDRIEAIDPVLHPGADFWRTFLDDHEVNLAAVASSTAAVVVKDKLVPTKPWVQGSAWSIGANLVVTNRHVLFPPLGGMNLARREPGASTRATIKSDLLVTVDFAFDSRDPATEASHVVLDVPYIAEANDPVDIAILRIDPRAGVAPSPALELADGDEVPRQLYVVGHPGRMRTIPEDVRAVFGDPDERKRISFGELMEANPALTGELLHDASTIGGYSGGCVAGFMARKIFGLHYSGDPSRGNRAIKASALRAHAVASYFTAGGN